MTVEAGEYRVWSWQSKVKQSAADEKSRDDGGIPATQHHRYPDSQIWLKVRYCEKAYWRSIAMKAD